MKSELMIPFRPLTRAAPAALALLALCATAACRNAEGMGSGSATLWREADGNLERRVITSRWDTLAAHVGGESDTLLTYPHRIAAHTSGVYVFDDGAKRLVSFDPSLSLRSVAGRSGAGPFEFAAVRDLVVTPEGDAAILDRGNARITIVGLTGEPKKMIPVRDLAGPEQVVVLDRNRYLVHASNNPRVPFVVIDSAGNHGETVSIPWRGFQRLAPLSSDGRLARDPASPTTWAFAFVRGNGWFSFDELRARDVKGRYLEHTEFPVPMKTEDGFQLRADAPVSGLDSAIFGHVLYVLFGGRDPRSAYRYVDRFDLRDGSYLGSYELPRQALAISVFGDDLYVLFQQPYPSIYRLRPKL
jgi:hypothetical protein